MVAALRELPERADRELLTQRADVPAQQQRTRHRVIRGRVRLGLMDSPSLARARERQRRHGAVDHPRQQHRAHLRDVDPVAAALQLRVEVRAIELDVVRAQHSVRERRDDGPGDFAELGCPGEVFVGDAVDLRGGHPPPRSHEGVEHDLRLVARSHEHDRDLDHAMVLRRQPGRLDVEDRERRLGELAIEDGHPQIVPRRCAALRPHLRTVAARSGCRAVSIRGLASASSRR